MATIDFGRGEQEFRCTARTLTVYEQAFYNDPYPRVTGDIIADVFGKQRITEEGTGLEWDDEGNLVAIIADFTVDNWEAEWRALWAMLKTQEEIDNKHGVKRERVPSFAQWDKDNLECEPNMREVGNAVCAELNRGLFRAGAAASGETSEEA